MKNLRLKFTCSKKPISSILLICTLLICSPSKAWTQNIYSALHHDKKAELNDSKRVVKIVQKKVFYNKAGKEVRNEIISLNQKHQILHEKRFDAEGNKTAELIFKYDDTQENSISRTINRWHILIGYTSETANYIYDEENFLIEIVDKNNEGKTIGHTLIKNNDKGDPIKLILKIPSSNVFEQATYNYQENMVLTEFINQEGSVINTTVGHIDFSVKYHPNTEYNEYGDIVKSEKYSHKYKYDDHNNWVKKKIFKIDGGRKKKDRVFTRKLYYQN